MSRSPSPTLRQRQLALRLREIRLGAGMKLEYVASNVMISAAHLSKIETATRRATLRNVKTLCDFYQVDDEVREQLMSLARDSEERSWWQDYDLSQSYLTYVGLESSAAVILEYHSSIVPGLLQTPAYAHAVADGVLFESPPDFVAQRVEARMLRQRLLTSDTPPRLWVVLDEAVLRRVVGRREVMQEQMSALVRWTDQAHVTVQVVPYSAGAYPGLDSSFTILELEEGRPDFVYVENILGDLYQEKSDELHRINRAFNHLRASALGIRDSRALIDSSAKHYST